MDPSTEVWDNFDVDLVIKVLANTAFSPVFVFFIPTFYWFQGQALTDPMVLFPGIYCAIVTVFWGVQWYSTLYRNQGSLLFAPPPVTWDEQVVVITGGSSGIGELIANTLAVRSIAVVVLDLKPIETQNYNITYYKCDVSNLEEVEAVAAEIREDVGTPTILINNAGVVQGKLLLDLTAADIKQTFDVNVISHFNTLKTFLPDMIKNKLGHVITVGSVMGMVGACQLSDYSASKAALMALHDSLRYELDKRYNAPGVRTTLVLPGHIQTPMFSRMAWPQSRIWRFFVPSLPPITVAKAIIRAIDNQHSTTIYLPFYANFASTLRAMPSFARDFCQWISGADDAMKPFVKINSRRPEEGPAPAPPAVTNGLAHAHAE